MVRDPLWFQGDRYALGLSDEDDSDYNPAEPDETWDAFYED